MRVIHTEEILINRLGSFGILISSLTAVDAVQYLHEVLLDILTIPYHRFCNILPQVVTRTITPVVIINLNYHKPDASSC